MKRIIKLVLLLAVVPCMVLAADTEMTMEEYNQALAAAQKREQDAKQQIAEVQAEIEDLKQQIADIESQIAAVIQEKYDILGITEEDVIAAENLIDSLKQELQLLLGLSPEELEERKADIKKIEASIEELKAKPVALLWKIRDKIKELDDLLARVYAKLPDKPSTYTVKLNPGNRDCLYRISGFDNIYDDVTEWPRLYRGNKGMIDQSYERYKSYIDEPKYDRPQDLIFPGQELDIPR